MKQMEFSRREKNDTRFGRRIFLKIFRTTSFIKKFGKIFLEKKSKTPSKNYLW